MLAAESTQQIVPMPLPSFDMKPSPIGVDDNFTVLGCAATLGGARLPCHSWMGFGLLSTNKLCVNDVVKPRGNDEVVIHAQMVSSTGFGVSVISWAKTDKGLNQDHGKCIGRRLLCPFSWSLLITLGRMYSMFHLSINLSINAKPRPNCCNWRSKPFLAHR